MLAERGSRVGLIPHPTAETSERILLVEGPPDMIAARSRGLPAIAVPGDHAWRSTWGDLLAGRQVTIVMNADTQGRAAARRISTNLANHAHPRIVELAPLRDDGYDLTDWLLDHPERVDVDALATRASIHRDTRQP
jgi:DNA primase